MKMAADLLLMRGINRFRKVTLGGQKQVLFNTPHLKEQVRLTNCYLSGLYLSAMNWSQHFQSVIHPDQIFTLFVLHVLFQECGSCGHQNASRFSGVMGVVECARGLNRYSGRSGHRLFGEAIRPAQQHVYGQICLFHQDHRYYSGLKREGVDTTKNAKTPDSRKHKQMVQHTKL